ncbi:hypothetical protein [Segetibacter aerophilus]|nr:hypothetical protein [Segetibacter aerophilus]
MISETLKECRKRKVYKEIFVFKQAQDDETAAPLPILYVSILELQGLKKGRTFNNDSIGKAV